MTCGLPKPLIHAFETDAGLVKGGGGSVLAFARPPREILRISEGTKEDKFGRGLKGVQLVISDASRGLVGSVADFRPEARYQHSQRL
jgi:hypothetical protein